MFVFTVVFGRLAGLPTEGDAPYAILVYAAMLPWQFFANALSESSNSLISNAQMITKIYFPRMFLPAAPMLGAAVDLAVAGAILVVLVALGVFPDVRFGPMTSILMLPVFFLVMLFSPLLS